MLNCIEMIQFNIKIVQLYLVLTRISYIRCKKCYMYKVINFDFVAEDLNISKVFPHVWCYINLAFFQ